MATHHPHGAKTPEEGAFAVDADLWKVRRYSKACSLQTHYYFIENCLHKAQQKCEVYNVLRCEFKCISINCGEKNVRAVVRK